MLRESEHACGNTTERDALTSVFFGELQAREVTAFQQLTVLLIQPAADDRPDRVQHIFTRQIVAGRDLRLTRRLLMPLRAHDLTAFVSQLYSRVGMDAVYNPYPNHTFEQKETKRRFYLRFQSPQTARNNPRRNSP